MAAEEAIEKAKEIEVEKERKRKLSDARKVAAKKVADNAVRVLAKDPKACVQCAENGESLGFVCFQKVEPPDNAFR